MTVLWISFAALYALGMLWLAYQIRTCLLYTSDAADE